MSKREVETNATKEKIKIPKTTYRQLAEYLGVTESAVKQYPLLKRELMVIGLKTKLEYENTK